MLQRNKATTILFLDFSRDRHFFGASHSDPHSLGHHDAEGGREDPNQLGGFGDDVPVDLNI